MPATTKNSKKSVGDSADPLSAADAADAATRTSSNKKRKMDPKKPKFYAVRAGRKPGVYLTYEECYKQIEGFKGSAHKAFETQEDAEAFVAGQKTSVDKKPTEDKFYAIAVGDQPGIYTDWTEAKSTGTMRKYKKFATRGEAVDFMRAHGNEEAQQWLLENEAEAPRKKAKKPSAKPYVKDDPDVVAVYTDGACSNNGHKGSLAGVGVYWGANDDRNVSERLEGEIQTNNRAELTAVLRALEAADEVTKLRIYTDSKHSIDCVTTWYKKWSETGEVWLTGTGTEVKNQDVIKAIRTVIDQRDEAGCKTLFQYVKGHADDPGNTAADVLAVAGSKMALKKGIE